MKKSITTPTKKGYKFGVLLYKEFCDFYNLEEFPSSTDILYKQLLRYATFRLSCADGTHSSLASDIAAIQFHLSINGVHSNVRNEFSPMKRIFKYAALHHPSKSQASRGLSLSQFQRLIGLFPPTSIDSIVFRTILSFAFATGMRGTEFLANNNKPNPTRKDLIKLLRRDRLFLWENPKNKKQHFGVVWFFDSKTNKSLRQEFATIPCCCKLGFCPILDLKRLISLIPKCSSNTVLFTWANGSFVTKSLFRLMLKQSAALIGIDPAGVGTHTTRKTCIQYAIAVGLPDSIIVQLGRWKCFHSIRPYINLSPLGLLKARENMRRRNDDVEKSRFRNTTNIRKI